MEVTRVWRWSGKLKDLNIEVYAKGPYHIQYIICDYMQSLQVMLDIGDSITKNVVTVKNIKDDDIIYVNIVGPSNDWYDAKHRNTPLWKAIND